MKKKSVSISVFIVFFSIMTHGLYAYAACNAMVNNRPMSAELCRAVKAVYGYVAPGHYWMDSSGNWVKLDAPSAGSIGNIYQDARRGGGGFGCQGRHGPYVTYRRAYEVAGNFQEQGCSTQVYTEGWAIDSPEYYVDVW